MPLTHVTSVSEINTGRDDLSHADAIPTIRKDGDLPRATKMWNQMGGMHGWPTTALGLEAASFTTLDLPQAA